MLILLTGSLFAQGKVYEGPDDPAGDVAWRREGYMNGNRVKIEFKNTTELSDWPDPDASLWPNAYYGYKMNDGIGLMVTTLVFIENGDTPVDDETLIPAKAAAGDLDTLYYLQTNYREEQDEDPQTGVEWNFQAAPGYVNPNSETPALSDDPASWPLNGWPARGSELKWPGEWDGRFGRGVIYSDLETYFVANDAQDQEYLPLNALYDGPRYYPRPGVNIGDKMATSVQNGEPWGGVGIRVEQRGFQWSNPQARDAIFWEYNIANISDYNLTQVAFGYWMDNAIGDDGNDDIAAFNRREDLAYSWDFNGIGTGGRETGNSGFAYLESPGRSTDGVDNDEDGITDEQRDNQAVALIGPTDGISDLALFQSWYKYSDDELREHWDADEDQDWNDGNDVNGNGVYDLGEETGDDLGTDGVGPGELNYTGPDLDGSECDHRPSMVEGVGAEPDFGETDISESDMLGLTMFDMFPIPDHVAPYTHWYRNDQSMWELMSQDSLNPYFGEPRNLAEVFATGVFPLYKGRTERVSMSELHAYDPLSGLNSEEHTAPALFKLKKTVQIIYERDYRFAQPPKTPTLKATPGDGKVILTWDNLADQFTREPFLNRINDFEGYKIYRATDKKMTDPMVVTDGFGSPTFGRPIFECDKADDITGFANYGLINGQGYYLGSDKGIAHSFIDNEVQNGRTYYYVLVSYDYGIWPALLQGDLVESEEENEGISPAESPFVIELNEAEEVHRQSKNVAIVTPAPMSSGFVSSSSYEVDASNALGTGIIKPEVVSAKAIVPGATYAVTFPTAVVGREVRRYEDHGGQYVTSGLRVWNVTDGGSGLVYSDALEELPDGFKPTLINTTLVKNDTLDVWHINNIDTMTTGIFDGIQLKVFSPLITAEYDTTLQGWLKGSAMEPNIVVSETEGQFFPWDYQIEFSDDPAFYTGRVTSTSLIRDERGVKIDRNDILKTLNHNFRCYNTNFVDTLTNDYELMDFLVHDLNQNGTFDILEDRVLVGPVDNTGKWAGTIFIFDFRHLASEDELPKAGDVYQIGFNRPWFRTDTVTFSVKYDEGLDNTALDDDMENIRVVPNPYVATNVMEPAIAKSGLNQRRRLMFTHVPAQCTIKIFTVSGVLVDEIEVDNSKDNGVIHWDLKSNEGLDIAAGMYLYHVKSEETGKEKLGKFAIIK